MTNSGTLDGAVSLGGGTNRLTNSGTIDGAVSGGNGTDAFTNTNAIFGDVSLGDGTNTLNNENRLALIQGDVVGGSGNDTITNLGGAITGTVFLGGGTNRLTNSGTIGGDDGPFNPTLIASLAPPAMTRSSTRGRSPKAWILEAARTWSTTQARSMVMSVSRPLAAAMTPSPIRG